MTDEIRSITDNMKALGFHWKARNYSGAKFRVTFVEVGDRPDPIAQTAVDRDLLTATKLCATKIIDFIKVVGEGWETRPIKDAKRK